MTAHGSIQALYAHCPLDQRDNIPYLAIQKCLQTIMEAMDVQNGGTITYFELVNALRVEMRLLREEENHQRGVLRKEDYERRREALVLQRTREE